jgi:hypothetical protein
VGGREYLANTEFPTFVVVDHQGKRQTIKATDGQWQARLRRAGTGSQVWYEANGLALEIGYITDGDRVNIVVKVLREGNWKLISIEGTLLVRDVPVASRDDYLVDGSGWLVFPDVPRTTDKRWDANSDNLIGGVTTAGFVAWREKDRIVFVKPLTFSHWLGWSAMPHEGRTKFELKAGLFFRPPQTREYKTKLAHDTLAIRLETAEDMNRDGAIDWVDAGIAYRERYIRPHRLGDPRHRLREAFRVYYSVHAYPSYEVAFHGLPDIDFADGIWWAKGMMEPAFSEDWESQKFDIRPNGE